MKKELEDAMQTLDTLNLELENIKNILVQKKTIIGNNKHSNHDLGSAFKNLKEENELLKQQLNEHKDFLNNVLESIEDVFGAIKELRDNE